MDRENVLALLRQKCDEAGGQKAWAAVHGVSQVYVSDVLAGRREPAGKIIAALGLERVVTFRKQRP